VFKGKQLAEIELPKEVIVSRHEEELPPPDPERDVIVAAAVQLEHHRREREDLKQQVIAARDELKERLMAAELVLQAKDVKIEECELALATERHRVAIFQDERDRAIAERCKAEADLRAMEQLYSNLFGMLDRFRLPVDIKRKTSGNGNGKHRISGGGADDDCPADAAISISA
jgi:Trm5-related predicted tRNA methylase